MNKDINLIAVRCVCGKKFRVRQKSQNAAIACPSCGHVINLSPATAVEKVPAHWTERLLKAIWVLPVCIAVVGILLIVFKERSDPATKTPVLETAAKIEATAKPKAVVEATKKVLFPGGELLLPNDLSFKVGGYGGHDGLIDITANAIFQEIGGKLTTQFDDVAAVQLATLVDDFDLDLLGKFGGKGGLYFLVGWDIETQTGYKVQYSRTVNHAYWQVHYIRDGKSVEFPTPIFNGIADKGKLSVSMKGRRLSVSVSGKSIIDDLFLEKYLPGQVIMGTWHNIYKGKALEISQIVMTSKFGEVNSPNPVEAVEIDSPLKNVLLEQIFPGKQFHNNKDFSYDVMERLENYRPNGEFKLVGDQLRGKRAESAVLELIDNTENFELTLTGDFSGRGIMFFPIGWDLTTSSGYFLTHNRVIHSGSWGILEIKNGKREKRIYVDSFRMGDDGTLSLKVENQLLSVTFDEHEITKEFYLPNYQSGAVLIGTTPNQYKSIDLVIEEIRYRTSK